MSLVVGLDLAGSPKRPTGACRLSGNRAETTVLLSDGEIMAYIRDAPAGIVAIDAPLTLPPGRKSIRDRNDAHYRPCDIELRKRKIPFFPVTLGPMRRLTERGMALRRVIERLGARVIEIYPGGAQDVWGIPRAGRDFDGLLRGLRRLGLRGLKKSATDHELDAASGALVGRMFLEGSADIYGDFKSGAIVMPRRPPAARR